MTPFDAVCYDNVLSSALGFFVALFMMGIVFFTARTLWWLHLRTQEDEKQGKQVKVKRMDINHAIALLLGGKFDIVQRELFSKPKKPVSRESAPSEPADSPPSPQE